MCCWCWCRRCHHRCPIPGRWDRLDPGSRDSCRVPVDSACPDSAPGRRCHCCFAASGSTSAFPFREFVCLFDPVHVWHWFVSGRSLPGDELPTAVQAREQSPSQLTRRASHRTMSRRSRSSTPAGGRTRPGQSPDLAAVDMNGHGRRHAGYVHATRGVIESPLVVLVEPVGDGIAHLSVGVTARGVDGQSFLGERARARLRIHATGPQRTRERPQGRGALPRESR